MNEPEWALEPRRHNSPYRENWVLRSEEKLLGTLRGRIVYGFLQQGGTHKPGWFVLQYALSEPIARMNPNLTLDEAQRAAKLLLIAQARSKT